MEDFLVNIALSVFIVGLFIGSILFTIYLFLNEKRLKEMKSIDKQRKMYKTALYVSVLIMLIGTLLYIIGMYTMRMDANYFGWIILSGGFIGLIYSLIGFYRATSI
jgi:hypothetical protein